MNPLHGILLKILSVATFIIMASLIKSTSAQVPAGQAVFFRSFFAIPVIVLWLAWRRELQHGLKTKNPLGHVWRGLVGTAAMGLGFMGLGLLPLPEVTAIGYAAPLLTVIFAAMFLGEQVRAFRLTAVGLGLVGVMIILSPRLSINTLDIESHEQALETLGAVVVFAGATCAALAQVFVRKLVQNEHTAGIVFYFSIIATTLSLLTIPFGWVIPDTKIIGMLILAGLLGGVGQILLTSSYRYADASVIAPFEYSSMLLALLIGYFFFGETPTPLVLLGATLIIIAGVIIIWRERQLGLERSRQRKAMTPQA